MIQPPEPDASGEYTARLRIVGPITGTWQGYCLCGASLLLTAEIHEARDLVGEWFERHHSGEGHGECDKRTAVRVRKEKATQQGTLL